MAAMSFSAFPILTDQCIAQRQDSSMHSNIRKFAATFVM
jgi:hypothetical protein